MECVLKEIPAELLCSQECVGFVVTDVHVLHDLGDCLWDCEVFYGGLWWLICIGVIAHKGFGGDMDVVWVKV